MIAPCVHVGRRWSFGCFEPQIGATPTSRWTATRASGPVRGTGRSLAHQGLGAGTRLIPAAARPPNRLEVNTSSIRLWRVRSADVTNLVPS
jgi:hypothetical protein